MEKVPAITSVMPSVVSVTLTSVYETSAVCNV